MADYITVKLKIEDVTLSNEQVKELIDMSRAFYYEVGNDMYVVTHNRIDIKYAFRYQYDDMRTFLKSLAPSIKGKSRVIGSINDSSEIPYKTMYYHHGSIFIERESTGTYFTFYDLEDITNECNYSLSVPYNEELDKMSIDTYIEYVIKNADD